MSKIIGPEDYLEPACLLCGDPMGEEAPMRPIPQQRIIEKMDEYMSRRDYAGAERHLKYWLLEATEGRDKRGELMVRGELIGHYRKTAEREKALKEIDAALALVRELDYGDTISAGTTYVNCATALSSFGENERALELFRLAQPIYENSAATRAELLGGLYNNMALCLAALSRYSEAHAYYDKAMEAMAKAEDGALEQAITCLNRANLVENEVGMEAGESRIFDLVDEAWDKLGGFTGPRDGYYAFVCEKCAPTFGYYGYFAAAEELKNRAEKIYDRT
ncbi:MAG: tetratricopeptide repeat protein [Oscillospiraceae bacterium]|nr:tetratricopeptide repeat protein [Oscillospiraceae bacterium]